MRGREVAEAILDLVQVLDQEITLTRLAAEERLDLGQGLGIDSPPARRFALALAGRSLGDDRDDGTVHASGSRAQKRSAGSRAAASWSYSSPAPRAHWYLAPSTATGISVEYA